MFKTIDVKENQDKLCQILRQAYTDKNKFDQIKKIFEDPLQQIGGITGSMYMNNKNSNVAASNVKAQQDLAKLVVLENNLQKYLSCVNSDLQEMGRQASKIYSLQDALKENRKKASNMQETAREAAERSQLVSDPYSQTSYQESWFPLGRPLKKDNVPVLLAFSIFFLVFAFAMFLRLSSLDLEFVPSMMRRNALVSNFISDYKPQILK